TKLSSIKAISPLSPSCKFPISKIGALSPELRFAPGNWTETCLEFESSTTDAISNDGENSIVLISNGTVTRTEALACCDGVSCTEATSKEKVSCTAVCMLLAGRDASSGVGVLIGGAVGTAVISRCSGMVGAVVICGVTGSLAVALGRWDGVSWIASTLEGSIADTGVWYGI